MKGMGKTFVIVLLVLVLSLIAYAPTETTRESYQKNTVNVLVKTDNSYASKPQINNCVIDQNVTIPQANSSNETQRTVSIMNTSEANVFVDPFNTITSLNDYFIANVTIFNVTNLCAFQIQVNWDKNEINCTDATEYDPLSSGCSTRAGEGINDTAGCYFLTYTELGCAFNGTAKLLSLTFYVLGFNTTANISLNDVELKDPNNGAIPATTLNGTVEIDSNTSTSPQVPPQSTTEPPTVNVRNTISEDFIGPYFDVAPPSVPITSVGETFLVTVALHNVTVENVPPGICGLEVSLSWNTSLIEPLNYTDYVGLSGVGALSGPVLNALEGFYTITPDGSFQSQPAPYVNATIFDVSSASAAPWWSVNSTGVVAVLAFRVKSVPVSSETCSINLAFATLGNAYCQAITPNIVPPWICGVSDSMAADGKLTINAWVQYGNTCTLSYIRNSSGKNVDWTNETMARDGSNFTGTIDIPRDGASVQYRIFAYDSSGRSNKTGIFQFGTNPTVMNVTSNLNEIWLPDNGVLTINASAQYAAQCTLYYEYKSQPKSCLSPTEVNDSGWTSVAMTKDGDNYAKTINFTEIPDNTLFAYKVSASDNLGHSFNTTVSWFVKGNKQDTNPWIIDIEYYTECGGYMIGVTVLNADHCVLSWRVASNNNSISDSTTNGTTWVNENMSSDAGWLNDFGRNFGTDQIHFYDNPNCYSVPYGTVIEYKVTAYSKSGLSTESQIQSFTTYQWTDP